jgi:site-specific DNA recombinase
MSTGNNVNNYRVGVYVRESRDDYGENYETIETQRDLLVNYINRERLGKILKIYIDNNVSGTVFDRDGIRQLREDVMSSRIDLLVLKDLSRLGRNNAKTLLLLDFLEEHGVRVITFDGRYDSEKDSDMVGIETWFNERYARDISRKIRANLRFKIEKGEYIGSAPYGYIKDGERKNRLVPDENTAFIVREIFELYREGFGYKSIANFLNSQGYPSPSARSGYRSGISWNPMAVRRILCNRVYLGDTVQGVSEKVSFKSKKTRRLPENSWVITQNTHEAIVSRNEFQEAQKIRKDKSKFCGPHKGILHLLRGKLFCGKCGSVMYARVRKGRPVGYICGNYGRNGRKACTSHHINEDTISKAIIYELLGLIEDRNVVEKSKALINVYFFRQDNAFAQIEKLELQLKLREKHQDILYSDRLEGKITEELFSRTNASIEKGILMLKNKIKKIKNTKTYAMDIDNIIREMRDDLIKKGLTHSMVKTAVEKITVFDTDDIIDNMEIIQNIAKTVCRKSPKGLAVVDFSFNKV